jgi:hypothetical protein
MEFLLSWLVSFFIGERYLTPLLNRMMTKQGELNQGSSCSNRKILIRDCFIFVFMCLILLNTLPILKILSELQVWELIMGIFTGFIFQCCVLPSWKSNDYNLALVIASVWGSFVIGFFASSSQFPVVSYISVFSLYFLSLILYKRHRYSYRRS